MERKRDFLTDEVMQVTWYVVYGSVHEQKNAIIYEMLPHVMNAMNLNYGEILWIPCPTNFDEADYKRDSRAFERPEISVDAQKNKQLYELSVFGVVATYSENKQDKP